MYLIFRKLYRAIVFVAVISVPVFAQQSKSSAKKEAVLIKANKKQVSTSGNESSEESTAKERLVEISTDYGVMVAKLYDNTPLHRDNFIKLVEQKFYDSLLFHRVINEFMIQGGDPASKNSPDSVALGMSSAPGERIPAEFKPNFFHKKGALAAARDENPEKASSNCQFYIVQGRPVSPEDLDKIYSSRIQPFSPSFSYTKAQREIYKSIGGTPFLDQGYTVFGEVISGLDIIDKIANLPKNEVDRPLQNVRMRIRMLE